jgi:hypothetical protein
MYIEKPLGETKAGVVLSFDDNSRAASWVSYHNSYGAAKGWKATFCVYADGTGVADIQTLVSAGHELGNHGENGNSHIESYVPVKTNAQFATIVETVDNYLFTTWGVRSKCYVWPLGIYSQFYAEYLAANTAITLTRRTGLLNHTTALNYVPQLGVKANGNYHANVVHTISMDLKTDEDYTNYFIPLLNYARDNGYILVMHGHTIAETFTSGLQTKRTVLDSICDYVNNNNMKFYTLNDIAP